MASEEPQEASRTYQLLHATLGRLIMWFFRVRAIGVEKIPKEPVIFVSAHKAVIDSYVIVAPLDPKRPVKFVAKKEYFDDGDLKQRAIRWLVSQAAVPLDREDRQSGASVQAELVGTLRHTSVGIHPEGTRAHNQNIYRAKLGFVYLAWETGAPVVPVLIRGAAEANPINSRRIRRKRITVEYLEARCLYEPKAVSIVKHLLSSEKLEKMRRRYAAKQAREIMEDFARRLKVHYVDMDFHEWDEKAKRFD